MKTFPFFLLVIFPFFLCSSSSLALTTAYANFEHPDGWRCELAQGVWICQSTVEPERKESVILSIATLATEWDTLDNFESYLKEPRTIQGDSGEPLTSKVTYARKRNINGTVWIDSLQWNSELPGFWARYVATVHNKLAILITYIVSEEYYSKLAPQFDRMISSLKPNAEFDLNIASKQGDPLPPASTKLGNVQKELILERLKSTKKPVQKQSPLEEQKNKKEKKEGNSFLFLSVTGAILLYLFYRIRKKRKQAKQPLMQTEAQTQMEPKLNNPNQKTKEDSFRKRA